jgi:hypothetical protein
MGKEARMDAKGDCHLLFVPVRESGSGMLALRTGRLPSGQRVGLAFTSAASLRSELGPGQPWIRLHEDAMRGMLGPAGIDEIRVDACLSVPPGAAEAAGPGRAQAGAAPPRPAATPPRRRTPPYRCASPAQARAVPGGGAVKARRGRGACSRPVQPGTRIRTGTQP